MCGARAIGCCASVAQFGAKKKRLLRPTMLLEDRGSVRPLASDERIASLDILVDFCPVIEIVRQRSMNLDQAERVVGADLVDALER